MDITSLYFPILVLLSAIVYYRLNQKYGLLFLSFLSCCFVASLNMNLLLYVLGYSMVIFLIGKRIIDSRNKKLVFRIGIIICLIQLIVFRYADFTLDPILNVFHIGFNFTTLSEIIVPIGISYFTLQGIGYLVNINMGWEKPEKAFSNFLLYIVFYPKFVSGPIERSNHFLSQLKKPKQFNPNNLILGIKLVLSGFFKKLIVANHLSPYLTFIYANPCDIGASNAWFAILIQPLYLYFDFSGYTDIAIGFAKMYGIDLSPNFERPFMAENISNFWKRFHMSLTSWFNDYVFMRVMFRYRKLKTYASIIALFVTWTLFGIWHGAGWNFMILGFIFAFAIIYEFLTKKIRYRLFSSMPGNSRKWAGRFFTYLFYGAALTFFFLPDTESAFRLLSKLTGPFGEIGIYPYKIPLLFGFVMAIGFLVFEVLQTDFKETSCVLLVFWNRHRFIRLAVYYIVTILIISEMGNSSSFVYEMF